MAKCLENTTPKKKVINMYEGVHLTYEKKRFHLKGITGISKQDIIFREEKDLDDLLNAIQNVKKEFFHNHYKTMEHEKQKQAALIAQEVKEKAARSKRIQEERQKAKEKSIPHWKTEKFLEQANKR